MFNEIHDDLPVVKFGTRAMLRQTTKLCSNGIFGGNWMGGGSKPKQPVQQQQQQNNQQQNQNNQQQQNNVQNDPNKQNNSGTNNDILDDIWKETKAADDPNKQQQNQQQQQQQQQQQTDPQKQVTDYLASVGLGEFTLTDAQIEQLKTGEGFPELMGQVNQRIQQSHLKAMSNVSTLVDAKVKAAVESAFDKSKSFFQSHQLRETLQEAMPTIAKDPNFGPVAETVLQQLLSKGLSVPKAIEGTKEYFKRMAERVQGENVNPNTRQPFRSGPSAQEGSGNEGWLDVLRVNN
jgi:hypothetical protein